MLYSVLSYSCVTLSVDSLAGKKLGHWILVGLVFRSWAKRLEAEYRFSYLCSTVVLLKKLAVLYSQVEKLVFTLRF